MEGVRVEVKIELGHKASCKKTPSPEGFTHDWVVFVRGPESCDISHFVEKVVFYLHESFAKPKRVLKDPPYTVAEAGYGSFFLPVEVFFKNKEEPRKLMFDYDLVLPACGSPPIDNIRSEALTFTNPTEEFRKKLVRGGGIVTSTGTVNGFHSSSLPVNGSAVQQSTDSRDGKMTKIITDSHPTLQLSTSATTESDKNKKGKHEAVVANKTVKMQESVTPGLKRSSSTSGVEDTQPVKKKKKKPDEASGKPNKPLGFIPLELPVAGNEHKEKLDEMKDVKLKIKSLSSKSPANDKKKNRRVSSEVGSGENVSNTSKRRESTSSKKSKKNSPKDDFKQQAKQEEKKVEKITFRRRGSGDSWSSSTSSSSLLGTSGGNKNMALDKLIAEMSEEDDDDDGNEVDVCTPFQSKSLQPSVTTQKPIADAVSSPNSTLQNKDSSNKGRTKSSSQVKKSEAVKNKRKNGLKSPKSLKQSPKPKLKDSTQASNGQRNSSSENLIQLYKRLVALKDSNLLQRIADILETTGRFELTETTLDFDLCSLDKTTIKKIESSINR